MSEEFEIAKRSLEDIDTLNNIWDHPVVKTIYEALNLFPLLSNAIDAVFSQKIKEYQKRKQEELCEIIFRDNSITLEHVKNVEVIMEYARMIDVVNRLATNKKLKYIANLFKKCVPNMCTYEGIAEFEEYLYRLDYISYREIDLLFILYDCEKHPLISDKKSVSKIDEAWKMFKTIACDKYRVNEKIIISMMSGLITTGFCREANVMFPSDDVPENPYYTTEYFERFLNLIS